VTKKLKHVKTLSPPLWTSQGTWVRSNVKKSACFAKQLAEDYQPHQSENEPKGEEALIQLLRVPLPILTANQMLQKN
jgi:hypothetical protein